MMEVFLESRIFVERKIQRGRPPPWVRAPAIKVVSDAEGDHDSCAPKNLFPVHDPPSRTLAKKLATICGKKIKTNPTTVENHSSTVLTRLGLQLHCLARQDL